MFKSRTIYALFGAAVALGFFGHGVLGTKTKDSFVELVTGTYDNVLGGTMSVSTAETWVNVVGWLDIGLAVAFLGLAIAAFTGRDSIAYSPIALGLFGWAVIWGFLTALSRYTASDFAGHELADSCCHMATRVGQNGLRFGFARGISLGFPQGSPIPQKRTSVVNSLWLTSHGSS